MEKIEKNYFVEIEWKCNSLLRETLALCETYEEAEKELYNHIAKEKAIGKYGRYYYYIRKVATGEIVLTK